MIPFFKNIRQKQLSEGKLSKYLQYALGEIILVVIGILLALQINNWNNERQQRMLEIKILNEIKSNLLLDLTDIKINIDFNRDKLRSNEIVLNYLNDDLIQFDSLSFHFGNILGSTRSIANSSAYENLKSRGLEIVTKDSLRIAITSIYEIEYHNVIDFEMQDDHKHQYEILWPEVMKAVNISEMWKSAIPVGKQNLKENYQFKNAIVTNVFIRKYMLSNYTDLEEQVTKVIKQIELELIKIR
jgi:hypothetical protein